MLGNGHLADTREVAAAKNAHYAALSSASAKASAGYGSGYGGGYGSGASYKSGSGYGSEAGYGGGAYQGPLAAPVVLSSGYLADTRDVSAAKNAHYSALLNAKSNSGYGNGLNSDYDTGYGSGADFKSGSVYGSGAIYGGGAYQGPLAAPVVLSSGYLADTRDVAAAKNAHYSALLNAKAISGYGSGLNSGYGSGASYHGGAAYGSAAVYGGSAYNGPLAAPVVLTSGYLADTSDVAAAKGAHYVALSQASSKSAYGGFNGSQGKVWH